MHDGVEYALVADYNFVFNDPHWRNDLQFGTQIGGKIGIIQDPLGKQGEPIYLGATTPIVGGAIDHLALSEDGLLYGDVFIDEPATDDSPERMYKALLVWNADHLIKAALDAFTNEKLSVPIDLKEVAGGYQPIEALQARKYDGPTEGASFGWIFGMASTTNCVTVRIIEIRGLYQPGHDDRAVKSPGTTRGSGYRPGYTSDDNKGRIFINHNADGVWTKNAQYIEITVRVDPPSVPIPDGCKITWTIEDPDDPTNEGSNVHPDVGKLLDPNDYSGTNKRGAIANDNDPSGERQVSARLEQIEVKYALSGNETLIDQSTRTSRVRFHVNDIAGDNYRVKADIKSPPAPITSVTPATTGVMTAWNKIDLEYVRMESASEIPVDQIAPHFDMACVQVDVSVKRVVTGASDKAYMGVDDEAAYWACEAYASKTEGEFSKEGENGWFLVVAANRFMPAANAAILFEGDAKAFGRRVRLPPGTPLSSTPAVVRVFNAARIAGMSPPKPNERDLHIKFRVSGREGYDLLIEPHDFHAVDEPDTSFLDADLSHYGFSNGTTIPIQVMSFGDQALVTGGISPGGVEVGGRFYFAGRLLVFTQSSVSTEVIGTLCHELCHAFDNAHKCGNWDWVKGSKRQSCCMNYWFQFVLNEGTPRAPIPWTQNRDSAELCGPHLRRIRDYHLEDNPGLGWGRP